MFYKEFVLLLLTEYNVIKLEIKDKSLCRLSAYCLSALNIPIVTRVNDICHSVLCDGQQNSLSSSP